MRYCYIKHVTLKRYISVQKITKTPYNGIIANAVFIIGLFASRSIFSMMRRRGVISVMSGDNTTFDLDELEPTVGSGVLKLTPNELTELFLEKKRDLIKNI